MHLYLGLKSLLKVHVTSTGCYSECFHLDDSTFKLPLLAASQRSLCSHSQCLLHTYFSHSVPTFGREFLASIPALPCKLLSPIPGLRGKLLSLSVSLSLIYMAHFSHPVLVGLANFFHLHLFFCPPTVV